MSAPWRALLALTGDLLRLRRGPQDAPHSPSLLLLALLPYAALSSLLASLRCRRHAPCCMAQPKRRLLAALVYATLLIGRRPARYVQTLTALVLTGLAFNALSCR